jgi:putative tryptophan/tyrosine transport system substrate-binding protein
MQYAKQPAARQRPLPDAGVCGGEFSWLCPTSLGAFRRCRRCTRTNVDYSRIVRPPEAQSLVASMNRPGGNATGVSFFSAQLGGKIVELLHSMVPYVNAMAVLVNPLSRQGEAQAIEAQNAAHRFGIRLDTFNASNEHDIETIFGTIDRNKIGGLIVTADPFFTSQRDRLVALAMSYAVPIISPYRELAVAGALMSYGASLLDAYRQAGAYVGRILKGEKPSELPIVQPTKFELVINLKTAKALHIEVPPTLLALTDDIIE